MINLKTLIYLIIYTLISSTKLFAYNSFEEEKYMLNYSINSDMESSVKLKYHNEEKNIANSFERNDLNEYEQNQANYSGYKNVQGYKNTNKSKSKRFAGIAIGVIVTGVALMSLTVAAIINAF